MGKAPVVEVAHHLWSVRQECFQKCVNKDRTSWWVLYKPSVLLLWVIMLWFYWSVPLEIKLGSMWPLKLNEFDTELAQINDFQPVPALVCHTHMLQVHHHSCAKKTRLVCLNEHCLTSVLMKSFKGCSSLSAPKPTTVHLPGDQQMTPQHTSTPPSPIWTKSYYGLWEIAVCWLLLHPMA